MELRNEFEKILKQYGYPVLVIRQNKKVRCSCWSEKRQEVDRECPVCFGLGYTPIVEKHTTRELDVFADTLPLIARDGNFGSMAIPGRQYYFKHNIQFIPGDLIVDVEWSEQGRPIYTGKGIYEISHVDPNRFERGENIFNKIYCKDQPVEKEIRGIRIMEINGITNYEIAIEG